MSDTPIEEAGRRALEQVVDLDRAHLRPANELIADVFAEVCALVEQKEQAYRGSWRKRGWRGNLERILSKSDRLDAMLRRTDWYVVSSEESVVDTALDQIALLAFFVINHRAGYEWGPDAAVR